MRAILHIKTKSDDAMACRLIARQMETPGYQVKVADLTSSAPDYEVLLQEIFTADSIAVW
jgi:hypothetical protein